MARTFDLHSHSTASDGTLSPAALVARAVDRGVGVLALTDHDTLAGLPEAANAASCRDIVLIPGVEISVTWEERTVHVVGLRVDPSHPELTRQLAGVVAYREHRAMQIAAELEQAGVRGALDGARSFCSGGLLSRTHFARHLVASGHAGSVGAAFRQYLSRGNPGYVPGDWADLDAAVGWITAAGGIAVLAHPARYRLTRKQLRRLLTVFCNAGGQGLEVVSGSHNRDEIHTMAGHARDFGLLASVGSDYHGPGQSYRDLGVSPPLPRRCLPVWHDWPEAV